MKEVDDTPLKFHVSSNLVQCPCCKRMLGVTLTEVE